MAQRLRQYINRSLSSTKFEMRRSATFSGLLLVLLLCGCGEKTRQRVPFQGEVRYNGQPLKFGTVMFQPAAGQPSRADIQPDGTFILETPGEGPGAVVGLNKIRITCYEPPRHEASQTNPPPEVCRSAAAIARWSEAERKYRPPYATPSRSRLGLYAWMA